MTFSLKSLAPEREPFELGDGRTIYFRNKADFDLQELAAWERLRKTLNNVAKMREKSTSEEQHAHATKKSDKAAREMIALVLPDLPSDAGLSAGQTDQLAAICINVASGMYAGSMGTEDEKTAVAEQYPNLPEAFIDVLSRRQIRLLITPEPEPEKN